MKRYRIWAVLLVVILMGAVVAGCGGSQPSAGEETAKEEGKEPAEGEPKSQYPERPIEFVVPFGAGGGSDILARSIAKVIQDHNLIDQPLMVVNKPGGSGSVGYSYLAEKKGDPYYIGTVSSSFYTAPLLGKSPVSYRDFTPVAGLAMDTYGLFVRSDSRFDSLQEILDEVKANPKSISVGGTSGTSDDAVLTFLLEEKAGVDFTYVPFESGGEVMTALLGGHVDISWANPGEALSQIEAGKARVLAVASKERLPSLPDVPTLIEEGVDVSLAQFRGVVMPKDVPEDAVKYMEEALRKMSETEDWKTGYIEKNMITARFLNSEEFGKAIVELSNMYEQVFAELSK